MLVRKPWCAVSGGEQADWARGSSQLRVPCRSAPAEGHWHHSLWSPVAVAPQQLRAQTGACTGCTGPAMPCHAGANPKHHHNSNYFPPGQNNPP